jgi:hypothetical protein
MGLIYLTTRIFLKTKDLYTTKDVQQVREQLLIEQDGYDKLTFSKILPKQACLDHNHDTLLVRGVLNRQANAALGKLEGVYTRYLSYWYTGTLSNFLRQAAEYLERPDDTRWRHPHFLKKLKTAFNKLPEGEKSKALKNLGYEDGKNSKERKEIFSKVILDRSLGYEKINNILKGVN